MTQSKPRNERFEAGIDYAHAEISFRAALTNFAAAIVAGNNMAADKFREVVHMHLDEMLDARAAQVTMTIRAYRKAAE